MKTKMDDKAKKNTLKIHKEATEWSKKIHILYEKLLIGSEVSKAHFFQLDSIHVLFHIVIELRPENYRGCNQIFWSKLPKTTRMRRKFNKTN